MKPVSSAAEESPPSGGLKSASPARRVAAQRQHVLDPDRREPVEDRGQPVAGLADAAQVGHRLEPVLALDPLDDLHGAVAGRAAGAVGDRDVVGLERLQGLDGLEQQLEALRASSGGRTRPRTPAAGSRAARRCAWRWMVECRRSPESGCLVSPAARKGPVARSRAPDHGGAVLIAEHLGSGSVPSANRAPSEGESSSHRAASTRSMWP